MYVFLYKLNTKWTNFIIIIARHCSLAWLGGGWGKVILYFSLLGYVILWLLVNQGKVRISPYIVENCNYNWVYKISVIKRGLI